MKRKHAKALASGVAALTLVACSTMPTPMTTAEMSASETPPMGNTVAGRYLAAKFAAASGDVKGAAAFYAETLKEDPGNRDLLIRAFMYAAESGDIEGAIALTDRVLAAEAENRPARLIRQADSCNPELADSALPKRIPFRLGDVSGAV